MMNQLQKLEWKINQIPTRSFFNPPATLREIQECEAELELIFPENIKKFYLNHNGGCFADASIRDKYLQDPDEIETIRWNSNYILSLEDIIDTYFYLGDIPTFDIQEAEKDSGRRFMPILHTRGQELLLLDLSDPAKEIPVIDGFHEVSYRDWKVLYPTFDDFLNDYIEKEGMINTIA